MIVKYFSVVCRDDRPATRVLLNDGKGCFADATADGLPGLADGDMLAGDAIALGDVNGDGDLDIVLTGDGDALRDRDRPEYVAGSKTRVLLGDGQATFANATKTFLPAPPAHDDWGGAALALGDLDGDGRRDDLVLTVSRPLAKTSGGVTLAVSSTRVFTGSSSGFEEVTADWMPPVASNGAGERWEGTDVEISDPDGDDNPDVFLVDTERNLVPDGSGGERQVSSLRWLARQAGPALVDRTALTLPDPADREDYLLGHAIALGDVDGDGLLDLVLTTELAGFLERGERPTRILRLE
jgi:hypothetical protein